MRKRLAVSVTAACCAVLCGCVTPLVPRSDTEAIVVCVMANCRELLQAFESSGRRVTVMCVLAKCQPLSKQSPD